MTTVDYAAFYMYNFLISKKRERVKVKDLKGVKTVLFDLDGTVYLGDRVIGDTANTLSFLRDRGIKVGFLTNNSSRPRETYIKKLSDLGLYKDTDFFYSSLDCAEDYFLAEKPDAKIFALATEKVEKRLKSLGLCVNNEIDGCDALLLTFDTEITYDKIEKANELLYNKKILYVATHPDEVCPMENGMIPDVGAFISLFKTSARRSPDVFTGKPFAVMGKYLLKRFGVKKEEVVMVGDRLSTDIAFGINSGFTSILVMSGETKEEDLKKSAVKPDIILKDVDELKKFF